MVRKLFRTGNSLVVAIPGAAAAALGVAEGDWVRVEHDAAAGALLLWPYAAHERLAISSEYVRVVGEFLRDYGAALAALDTEAGAEGATDGAAGAEPETAAGGAVAAADS